MEKALEKDDAARVRRAVRAGRPPKKDMDVQALQGVRLAVSLLKQFREEMQKAGLLPQHAIAKLIFMHPKKGAGIVDITPKAIDENMSRLSDVNAYALAILFGQYDAKKSQKFFWTKNFVNSPEALRVAENFTEAEKKESGLKS